MTPFVLNLPDETSMTLIPDLPALLIFTCKTKDSPSPAAKVEITLEATIWGG